MTKKLNEAYIIHGGVPLHGEIKVNTAKNSALVLILAALLTEEKVVLKDIPKLSDILIMCELLEHFGAEVHWYGHDLHIEAKDIHTCTGPYHLVSKMRASFVALGPLLGRCKEAGMAMPGGCAFGPRPVDRHIKAFKDIGAIIEESDGDFRLKLNGSLKGTARFVAPTVGGTQNILLASVLGEHDVTIENAAKEPEITDLVQMLKAMGAQIEGEGTDTLKITGVSRLRGLTYRPIPDRIEAGTFILAAAATRGKVSLHQVEISHLSSVIAKLSEAGVKFSKLGPASLLVDATGDLQNVSLYTSEYPGIPTDVQAPFTAFLATLEGDCTIEERVYPGHRFTHVAELHKMQADIELEESTLSIRGGTLQGAKVHSADIRAGGAMVIAGLAAQGTTVVTGLEFIDRGYEVLDERLRGLGADIHRQEIIEALTGTYGD
ncbi:MAG: UDP-N-acetylglucosamine 1-carboxyvinyltransferase [Trueperaceae bacterium]|nr:UDP-N-acetylglucosamine 1-carboxyvinyltransferase [Trueperaceae bacterium]